MKPEPPSEAKSCVLVVDMTGKVTFASIGACHAFGVSDETAIGNTFDDLMRTLKGEFSWVTIEGYMHKHSQYETVSRFVSRRGERGSMLLHAHPVVAIDGVAVNCCVILMEVLNRHVIFEGETPQLAFAGKYSTTSLTYENGRELFLKMDLLVRHQELFLEGKLSVSSLAQKLNTNTQYLSHVINYFCGERFPSYINRMRIQWMAAQVIQEGDGGTARKAWQKAGFGSYSAYHRAVRSLKGQASLATVEAN